MTREFCFERKILGKFDSVGDVTPENVIILSKIKYFHTSDAKKKKKQNKTKNGVTRQKADAYSRKKKKKKTG